MDSCREMMGREKEGWKTEHSIIEFLTDSKNIPSVHWA